MKRSWTYLLPAIAGILASADAAFANSSAQDTLTRAGSLFVDSLALLVAAGCALVTFRLYSSIRGGKVGRGWRWILLGLLTLGVAQLWLFASYVGVAPNWGGFLWVDTLRLASLVLLFIGVTRLRKLFAG